MRRFLLVTLIAVGLLALASPPFSPQAMASTRQNQTSMTISIPATQPWTDTGIDLTQGSSVSITASGTIYIAGSDPGKTPDGDPSCTADSSFVAAGLNCWSLIGNIANGTPFEVGSSASFTASASGRLYLGVNDQINYFGDNSGSWTAIVTFTAPPPQQADLVVTKTVADPAPNYQGDEADYQITVTNQGPGTATNVSIIDNLPTGIMLENPPQTSQGTCTHTSISVTCALGDLAIGTSAQVFLTTSTYNDGKITNQANGTATQTDPNLANNTGSTTITLKSAKTSSSLRDQLRQFGIKLKAVGIILEEAECGGLQDGTVCALLGTELLADQPGLTGERAASYLRYELATLCINGLATDDLFECTDLWINAISELAAPPPAG